MRYGKAQPAPFLTCSVPNQSEHFARRTCLRGLSANRFRWIALPLSCSPAPGGPFGTSGRCGPHAGTPQCVWPAGGLVLPTGLVGHRMLVWVFCYVCIIYNKMGVEAEPSACLGRCTYNTEKADIQTS